MGFTWVLTDENWLTHPGRSWLEHYHNGKGRRWGEAQMWKLRLLMTVAIEDKLEPGMEGCQWWKEIFSPKPLLLSRRTDGKDTFEDMVRSRLTNEKGQEKIVRE